MLANELRAISQQTWRNYSESTEYFDYIFAKIMKKARVVAKNKEFSYDHRIYYEDRVDKLLPFSKDNLTGMPRDIYSKLEDEGFEISIVEIGQPTEDDLGNVVIRFSWK